MSIKAPKGGLVSPVNGQFYEGGEFIPEHGLFCGRKGAQRAARREHYRGLGRYVEAVSPAAPGAKMYQVYSRRSGSSSHVSDPIGVAIALSEKQAREAFPAQSGLWAQPI